MDITQIKNKINRLKTSVSSLEFWLSQTNNVIFEIENILYINDRQEKESSNVSEK